MSTAEMEKYKGTAPVAVNELKVVPEQVIAELEAHRQHYLRNPEQAHYWDPAVIGIPGGPVPCLLLEYTGRKSGKPLSMAIQYYRRNGQLAIVASKGGTEDNPAWYLNLLANPACRVHIGSFVSDAVARVVSADEHPAWWEFIVREQPIQAVYQARTARQIPVVILDLVNPELDRQLADLRRRYPTEPTVDKALTRKLRNRDRTSYAIPTLEQVGQRLTRWLTREIAGPFTIRNLRALTGGASKEQYLFELDWEQDGKPRRGDRMVLRCDPAASIVETARSREFELMRFAAKVMPVPPVYWIDEDGDAMGTPSLISGFITGVQKPASASSNVTGMGIHFPADYRDALRPQYARYMADLHRAPIEPGELPSFVRPEVGTTQASELLINWWARTWAEDLYEHSPIATLTEQWLRSNMPVLDHLSVVHGDFRTGNFLFDEETRRITGLLDWEMGYLGDRHGDLGWVVTDLYMTYEDGKPFHCGLFSSTDELLDAYAEAGGLPIDRQTLRWHKMFCTWKQLILSLACALRAGDGRSHQDVLLSWLSAGGYTLSEALRLMLEGKA